jgi:hypothetical protein
MIAEGERLRQACWPMRDGRDLLKAMIDRVEPSYRTAAFTLQLNAPSARE